MSSPQLVAVVKQVTDEVLRVWWQHDEQGTEACVPHLSRALTHVVQEGAQDAVLETLSRRLAQRFGVGSRVAARAIQQIGPIAATHPRIVPLLLERARDARSGAQYAAIEALACLGLAASSYPELQGVLLSLLRDSKVSIALAATRALRRLAEAGDADLRRALAEAEAQGARVRYLLSLVDQEPKAATVSPSPPDDAAHRDLPVSAVIQWAEELEARDPVARARAAQRLAEAESTGVRIFGSKRQVRVVSHRQLQYAAALQRKRSTGARAADRA
jgi:hypothetical protein